MKPSPFAVAMVNGFVRVARGVAGVAVLLDRSTADPAPPAATPPPPAARLEPPRVRALPRPCPRPTEPGWRCALGGEHPGRPCVLEPVKAARA